MNNRYQVNWEKEFDKILPPLLKTSLAGTTEEKNDKQVRDKLKDLIRTILQTAQKETIESILKEIKELKIPTNKMNHDLRGNCDFERNHTIDKILQQSKDRLDCIQ